MDYWIPYKQIPADYKIVSIFPDISAGERKDGFFDYNTIFVLKEMHNAGLLTNGTIKSVNDEITVENEHLYNGCEYSNVLYQYLSKEYMDSAKALATLVSEERKKINTKDAVLSSYANPCAFLCRHAIELKLKQCLACQSNLDTNHHNLIALWEKINKDKLDSNVIFQLTTFISEISKIDPNGESIRYGTDKKALPIKEPVNYDCLALISNAMYLFNQLHKIAF